ncbi:hemolysin family protein [Galenea microaerophila]
MDTTTSLIIIVLLLITNGFFVAAEFALVKVRMGKAETFAKEGGLTGKLLLKIKNNLESYLAACQLGITMASLGLGWVGEPAVAKLLEPLFHSIGMPEEILHPTAFLIGFILFSSLHIVIGEQVPKTFAIRKPDSVSLWVTLPLEGFYWISYPLTKALHWASGSILRAMGIKEASHEEIFSAEELSELIETASEHGTVDDSKADMIQNMFEFDNRIVRDIMVPRNQVDYVDLQQPLEDILNRIKSKGHSRFPLTDGGLENPIGVLLVKDLTSQILDHKEVTHELLRKIAREPLIIPELMGLQKAFDEMRCKNAHMAFVIDEHGAFSGLITMEDLIEEIVGEIADELDDEVVHVHQENEKVDIYQGFEVDGLTPIHEFEKLTHTKFSEPLDVSTLSGLIMLKLNGLANVGDTIEYDGWFFKVLEIQNHRPEKVFVKRLTEAEQQTSEETN